jgi:hypothetical protein
MEAAEGMEAMSLDLFAGLHRGAAADTDGRAVFSPCGLYRYEIERHYPTGTRTAMGMMLNPSYADAKKNDPTMGKVAGFSSRLDICRWIQTNLSAFISTDANGLRAAADPIGPKNDQHIVGAALEADIIVVGWGGSVTNLPDYKARIERVLVLLRSTGKPILCWGRTAAGHPRHPLMLRYSTPLEAFT